MSDSVGAGQCTKWSKLLYSLIIHNPSVFCEVKSWLIIILPKNWRMVNEYIAINVPAFTYDWELTCRKLPESTWSRYQNGAGLTWWSERGPLTVTFLLACEEELYCLCVVCQDGCGGLDFQNPNVPGKYSRPCPGKAGPSSFWAFFSFWNNFLFMILVYCFIIRSEFWIHNWDLMD